MAMPRRYVEDSEIANKGMAENQLIRLEYTY